MPDLTSDRRLETLRAESDAFLAQLNLLHDLEMRKRDVPPGDAGFLPLASEVEDSVAVLLARAKRQTAVGKASTAQIPLTAVPDGESAVMILSRWRELERRINKMDPSSDEAADLRREADAFRRAYEDRYRGLVGRSVPESSDRVDAT
jgi:hypothetical protein